MIFVLIVQLQPIFAQRWNSVKRQMRCPSTEKWTRGILGSSFTNSSIWSSYKEFESRYSHILSLSQDSPMKNVGCCTCSHQYPCIESAKYTVHVLLYKICLLMNFAVCCSWWDRYEHGITSYRCLATPTLTTGYQAFAAKHHFKLFVIADPWDSAAGTR